MRRALAIVLTLFAVLLVVVELRYAPPAVVPASAPPDVFSAERARVFQSALVGDGATRAVGTPGHRRAQQWIEGELARLGWQVGVQESVGCSSHGTCARVANVVGVLEGTDAAMGAVLMSAHYDSVDAGPGAADDGFGVATLLETARALGAGPRPRRTMIVLFTDAEEAGLLGAGAFAREHPLVPSIRATINVDSRGARGPSQMFQTSPGNAAVIRLVRAHLPRPVTSSLYYEIYKRMPNGTDFDLFKSMAPGVDFANTAGMESYHSPLDTVALADPRTLQHDGDHVLAMAHAFSEGAPGSSGGSDAVWFDVLAFFIVSWPMRWTMILALGTFALLLGQVLRRRDLGIGLVAFGLVPLGLLAGVGLTWLLGVAGALPAHFVAHPLPALAGLHLATAAAMLALGRRLGARPEITWSGVWLGWAAVGLALAATMPGASFLFVVPALAAAVLGALRDRIGFGAACVVPPVVAAVLVLALVPGLYETLGFALPPMLVLPTALLGSTLLPLVGAVSWRPPAALAGAALVASGLALAVPGYGMACPQRANVVLWQQKDGDASSSRVLVDTSWGQPRDRKAPAAMLAALQGAGPTSVDARNGNVFASVPAVDAPAPAIEILASSDENGKHRAKIRLRTQRGANAYTLRFDGTVALEVKVDGRFAFPAGRTLRIAAPPDVPLVLDIEAAAPGPIKASVADRTYGLPPGTIAAAVVAARPPTAMPTQEGDVTVIGAIATF